MKRAKEKKTQQKFDNDLICLDRVFLSTKCTSWRRWLLFYVEYKFHNDLIENYQKPSGKYQVSTIRRSCDDDDDERNHEVYDTSVLSILSLFLRLSVCLSLFHTFFSKKKRRQEKEADIWIHILRIMAINFRANVYSYKFLKNE